MLDVHFILLRTGGRAFAVGRKVLQDLYVSGLLQLLQTVPENCTRELKNFYSCFFSTECVRGVAIVDQPHLPVGCAKSLPVLDP